MSGFGKDYTITDKGHIVGTPPDAEAVARADYERLFLEARFAHEHLGPSEVAAAIENLDVAWDRLREAVERRVRAAEAEREKALRERIGKLEDALDYIADADCKWTDHCRAATGGSDDGQ